MPGPPDVLLISLDTTRADRLGVYGLSSDTCDGRVSSLVDSLSTVHSMAGLPGSWDTPAGNAMESRGPLLATTQNPGTTWAVTDGTWRLLRHADSVRLYDRRTDPFELQDLAAERPELVERLSAVGEELLAEQAEAASALGPPVPAARPSDEVIDTLRSLGYVQ